MVDTAKMSLAEYFAYKGIKEATRIEVTYEDGTKVALDGHLALMWWRTAHFYQKEDTSDRRDKDVYVFRAVDDSGKLAPLTIPQMIEAHVWGTGICSFAHHMRSISPTYKDIMALGDKALPDIFKYMQGNPCGMNVILLLEDITKTSPYHPEAVAPGFVGYKVKDGVSAWLEWGKRNNYIK